MDFVLPTNKQRVLIVGRTGSGKTYLGAWLTSRAPFDVQPYIIIDYKGDELLGAIEGAREIGYKDKPKHPGLYYMRAMPGTDDEMNAFLWEVWKRGKTGLVVDEGYMLPNDKPLQAILTQGRSLRIPLIMLTQRPVLISRFAVSEADFYAVFRINDKRDFDTVASFTPKNAEWDYRTEVPKYHSRWYDVSRDYSTILTPVPGEDEILQTFEDRINNMRKRRII